MTLGVGSSRIRKKNDPRRKESNTELSLLSRGSESPFFDPWSGVLQDPEKKMKLVVKSVVKNCYFLSRGSLACSLAHACLFALALHESCLSLALVLY